jgi:hypothetical protein
MSKPTALSNEQLAYCQERLRNQWPWTPHTYPLIAALVAMAQERNDLLSATNNQPQPSLKGL